MMCSSFVQNEWDELMLETFTLKQHLESTRQELSQALYQHDAACRVIARLMRERDEARGMLASLSAQGVDTSAAAQYQQREGQVSEEAGSSSSSSMEVEQEVPAGQLSASVLAVLGDTCATLSKGRKGRKATPEQATREQVTTGCEDSPALSVTPHASAKPGVTCLAMSQSGADDQGVALSGGADKMAFLTELGGGKVVAKLSGHSKKVTAVALHSSSDSSAVAFTASADNSVKVWAEKSGSYSEVASFPDQHSGEIHSLCAHPSGDYLLGVSADNSWSFMDVAKETSLLTVDNTHADENFSCGGLHPDGLILACGASSGAVRLWDIREQKNVASLGEDGVGHAKGVSCLNFNQNGYLLASGGAEGNCKVWDLRKLKEVASLASSSNKAISSVAFDPAGMYLAYGSASGSVDMSVVKEWNCLCTLAKHKKAVTGLAWGTDAGFLLSASMDRSIKKQSFK
jgi:pre-mRNA-processing factor 19